MYGQFKCMKVSDCSGKVRIAVRCKSNPNPVILSFFFLIKCFMQILMGMSRKTLCQSSSVFAFSNGEKAVCKFVVLLSHSCDHGTRKYFRWRLEPIAKKSGHNHYKPVVLNKRKKQRKLRRIN